MNPAQTFGSALGAWYWEAFWLYLIASTLGVFAAPKVFCGLAGELAPTVQRCIRTMTSAAYFTTDTIGARFIRLISREKS